MFVCEKNPQRVQATNSTIRAEPETTATHWTPPFQQPVTEEGFPAPARRLALPTFDKDTQLVGILRIFWGSKTLLIYL